MDPHFAGTTHLTVSRAHGVPPTTKPSTTQPQSYFVLFLEARGLFSIRVQVCTTKGQDGSTQKNGAAVCCLARSAGASAHKSAPRPTAAPHVPVSSGNQAPAFCSDTHPSNKVLVCCCRQLSRGCWSTWKQPPQQCLQDLEAVFSSRSSPL